MLKESIAEEILKDPIKCLAIVLVITYSLFVIFYRIFKKIIIHIYKAMSKQEEDIELSEKDIKHFRILSAPELREIRKFNAMKAFEDQIQVKRATIMKKIQNANNLGLNQVKIPKKDLDREFKYELRNNGYVISKPEDTSCLSKRKPNARIIKWILSEMVEVTDEILNDIGKVKK